MAAVEVTEDAARRAMPTRSGVLSLTPEDTGVEMEKLAEDINDKVSACLKTKDELHSELLCFVVDKSKILPFDDLIKLCCDFYREEEILEARAVLFNFCKLYKQKGSERMRNTMEDIVKAMLNPDMHLPVFYAIDL